VKLVVVSHPCVTPVNQDFFARVQRLSGWELAIVLPSAWRNEYGTQRASRWPAYEGELVPAPVGLRGNIPLHFYLPGLARVFRRLAPDAVYVHHEPYALATFQAFRALKRGVPIGFYSAQNLIKRNPPPFAALERRVYRRAVFALAVSDRVSGVLRTKGYKGRLEVLPLAVDTRAYRPHQGSPSDSNAVLRVAYVGRLADEKGVDTVLEALARVRDVKAEIIGDGPARSRLRRQADDLGLGDRVYFTGYAPHADMPAVYGRADVVIVPSRTVPSWTEQFGRVVIEALSCSVPVVTSDSGELPDLVAKTGGGWTFPEGDADALAHRLAELKGDPDGRIEHGRHGREAVTQLFDVDAVANRFIDVIKSAGAPNQG
jgi:glycosyltransferase involved in cell wall biosynthesis